MSERLENERQLPASQTLDFFWQSLLEQRAIYPSVADTQERVDRLFDYEPLSALSVEEEAHMDFGTDLSKLPERERLERLRSAYTMLETLVQSGHLEAEIWSREEKVSPDWWRHEKHMPYGCGLSLFKKKSLHEETTMRDAVNDEVRSLIR